MKPVGIVTGMRAETECLSAANFPHTVFCAGGSPGRAHIGAQKLIERGAEKLISFGIAGALEPTHRPGDIVLASFIEDYTGHRFPTDPAWRERMTEAYSKISSVTVGTIVTTERAIADAEDKAALFQRTNAVAVDMESAGTAAAALESRIPFLAVRVIADTSAFTLPQCAMAGLAEDGSTRPGAVLAQLAARPWEFFRLLKLAGASKTAMNCLGRVAAAGF